jgi:hypothetical protein
LGNDLRGKVMDLESYVEELERKIVEMELIKAE